MRKKSSRRPRLDSLGAGNQPTEAPADQRPRRGVNHAPSCSDGSRFRCRRRRCRVIGLARGPRATASSCGCGGGGAIILLSGRRWLPSDNSGGGGGRTPITAAAATEIWRLEANKLRFCAKQTDWLVISAGNTLTSSTFARLHCKRTVCQNIGSHLNTLIEFVNSSSSNMGSVYFVRIVCRERGAADNE